MLKKVSILIGLFVTLLVINYYISLSIILKESRLADTRKLFDEIGSTYEPGKQFTLSSAPMVLGIYEGSVTTTDGRSANLKNFFRKYNSPLFDFTDQIVAASDQNGFDYRLLPAIAMQESNLCKYIPENSHNCWGWGIYGDTVTKFDTYNDAIDTVSRGLKRDYIDKGLTTASSIMAKYNPSSTGSWAHGVNTFLRALE